MNPPTPCRFLKSGTNDTTAVERQEPLDKKGKVGIGAPGAELTACSVRRPLTVSCFRPRRNGSAEGPAAGAEAQE